MLRLPACQNIWLRDENGVTSIEYALIGSLIAMVIIGAVFTLGDAVNTMYQGIAAKMP